MDWMGNRLARLIDDGKKALGKGVVVMSEVQEDEVDDGSRNWEEEVDPDISVSRASRSGSVRRRGQHRTPRRRHHTIIFQLSRGRVSVAKS